MRASSIVPHLPTGYTLGTASVLSASVLSASVTSATSSRMHKQRSSTASCVVTVHWIVQRRRVLPAVLRNIKTWYTYYKAPQINKFGYGGQPVNKAVCWVSNGC